MGRRRKKLPNTEQLGNGQWRFVKWLNRGKPDQICLRSRGIFADSASAWAALQETLGAVSRPGGYDAVMNAEPVPTFGELAEEWITKVVPRSCKESTCEDYQVILNVHALPEYGDAPVDEITRKRVKMFLLGKLEHRAPSTVKHIQAVLSGVLALAVDDELIPANPAQGLGRLVSKDDEARKEVKAFSAEEVQTILAEMAAPTAKDARTRSARRHYYPLVLCLARTGMRIGEALGLRWDDIDLDSGQACIKRSYSRGRLTRPKNSRMRDVDLSSELTAALRALKVQSKRKALQRGEKPRQRVFVTQNGAPVGRNRFRGRVWVKLLKDLGMAYRKPHALRHTYVSLRLMAGHDPWEISKQTGHNLSLMMKVYAHWIPKERNPQIDDLDSLGGMV